MSQPRTAVTTSRNRRWRTTFTLAARAGFVTTAVLLTATLLLATTVLPACNSAGEGASDDTAPVASALPAAAVSAVGADYPTPDASVLRSLPTPHDAWDDEDMEDHAPNPFNAPSPAPPPPADPGHGGGTQL